MSNLTKIIRGMLIVGLFIVLLTPLVTIKSVLYPFVFGKALFLQIILEILFPFWVALLIIDPAARPKRSPILWGALLFGAMLLAATVFGIDPHKSFWGTDERASGVFTQLHYLVFFLMLPSVFRTRKDWRRVLWLILGVGFVLSVQGIIENFASGLRGGTRVMAVFGNPILFGGYLLFPAFLSIYVFLETRGPHRFAALGIFAASVTALLFTQTRGAVLGAIVGCAAAVCLRLVATRPVQANNRLRVFVAFGAVAILTMLIVAFRDTPIVKSIPGANRLTSISIRDTTATARFLLWRVAIRGFAARPFLGWGPENFDYVFDRYYDPYFLRFSIGETWSDRAHNAFLDLLTMTGVVGFAAYMFLIGAVVRKLWREARKDTSPEVTMLAGLLVAYLVSNFFAFDSPSSALLFFFLLALVAARGETGQPSLQHELWSSVKAMMIAVAAVLSIAGLIVHMRMLRASQAGLIAATMAPEMVNERWLAISRALQMPSPYLPSIRQRFANAIFLDVGNKGPLRGVDAEKFLALAIEEMKKNIVGHPHDFAYWFTLGNLYTQAGIVVDPRFFQDAETAYMRGKEESPKRQALYFQLASVKLLQHDFPAAVEILKPVTEFDPRVGETHWLLGVAYGYNGERKEALSAWRVALMGEEDAQSMLYDIIDTGVNIGGLQYAPSVLKEVQFAVHIAFQEKDFELLRVLTLLMIQLDAPSADNFGKLAAVELELGNFTAARAAARYVINIDPASGAEAEAFLNEIDRREQNLKF